MHAALHKQLGGGWLSSASWHRRAGPPMPGRRCDDTGSSVELASAPTAGGLACWVCLFVCLFVGLRTPVVCGGLRLTKDGTYATRGARPQGQADAVLFVRRIPTPPLVRAPGDILRGEEGCVFFSPGVQSAGFRLFLRQSVGIDVLGRPCVAPASRWMSNFDLRGLPLLNGPICGASFLQAEPAKNLGRRK